MKPSKVLSLTSTGSGLTLYIRPFV
ncbi:hypothetical protein E2C01_092020 [Portunus trituberculatus]|uniref:Uncharacterized protein n=1 Tax=Portunus trituberculatus TaxID=210409 RepID=A0A5B7JWN3_PORTR|nr:hypothetical protein [Portunus trituberculatus]